VRVRIDSADHDGPQFVDHILVGRRDDLADDGVHSSPAIFAARQESRSMRRLIHGSAGISSGRAGHGLLTFASSALGYPDPRSDPVEIDTFDTTATSL
jgi:hypothetical protein